MICEIDAWHTPYSSARRLIWPRSPVYLARICSAILNDSLAAVMRRMKYDLRIKETENGSDE